MIKKKAVYCKHPHKNTLVTRLQFIYSADHFFIKQTPQMAYRYNKSYFWYFKTNPS